MKNTAIKKITIATLAMTAFSTANFANAAALHADLNSDTIKAQYDANSRNADLGINGAIMLTDDHGEAYSLGIHSQGMLNRNSTANIYGGFGLRGYHVAPEHGDSFQGLAFGGFVEVGIPQLPDVTLDADFYYAPSITLTDDMDNMHELNIRLNYQVFKNAKVYIGLRDFEAGIDDYDYNIDDGANIGFTVDF